MASPASLWRSLGPALVLILVVGCGPTPPTTTEASSGASGTAVQATTALTGAAEMFDTSTYYGRLGRLGAQIESLLFVGKQITAMNRDLIHWAAMYRPDVIWIDRGSWLRPQTLRQLREMEIFLVPVAKTNAGFEYEAVFNYVLSK